MGVLHMPPGNRESKVPVLLFPCDYLSSSFSKGFLSHSAGNINAIHYTYCIRKCIFPNVGTQNKNVKKYIYVYIYIRIRLYYIYTYMCCARLPSDLTNIKHLGGIYKHLNFLLVQY